jgi:hypothetical protein
MNEIAFELYQSDRYGHCDDMPDKIFTSGTLQQAIQLLDYLDYYMAGQQGMWLIRGYEDL